MNYISQPMCYFLEQGWDIKKLHYQVQQNPISPYLEIQSDSLYETSWREESFYFVDVNPYVRFSKMFESLLTPDDLGYTAFTSAFSDILMHLLADLDLYTGQTRQEFFLSFLLANLETGSMGGAEEWNYFSKEEKKKIALQLFVFYQTSDWFSCLHTLLQQLLPMCGMEVKAKEELLFYLKQDREEKIEAKLKYCIRLFLPVSFSYQIHWNYTYGVIGYGETMRLEQFIL